MFNKSVVILFFLFVVSCKEQIEQQSLRQILPLSNQGTMIYGLNLRDCTNCKTQMKRYIAKENSKAKILLLKDVRPIELKAIKNIAYLKQNIDTVINKEKIYNKAQRHSSYQNSYILEYKPEQDTFVEKLYHSY